MTVQRRLALAVFAAVLPGTVWADSAAELERAENAVLVMEVKATDVAPEEGTALTAEIAAALDATGAYKVMTVSEINQVANLQKKLGKLGCLDDSCVAELSKIANAALVLSGAVGKVGDEFTFSLSLINVDQNRSVGSATEVGRDLGALRRRLPDMIRQLVGHAASAEGPRYQLPEGKEVSFAVLSLKPLGLDAATATNLTEVLAAEVKSIDGTSVISPSDITSMLEMQASKDALDCSDTSCLAEIGGALGVDQLIVGDVGRVGDRFVVSLRIVNARNPEALSRVNESFEGIESQLVPAVKQAARDLLGLAPKDPGILVVESTEEEAEAKVNGELAGVLPATTLGNFAPGKYSLLVSKRGYIDWRSDVYVTPNATTNIWVRMEETPVKWVFWGFASVTAASLLGGGLTLGLAAYDDAQSRARLADGLPGFMIYRERARNNLLASNIFWVSSGVLAVGTGVAALLTDWD